MTGVDEGAFVGREEIIAEVLRWVPDEQGRVPARGEIGPGSPATRQHAYGTWGIGKTTLLDELERQLRATSEALILRVDAGEWVPTAEPGPESGLPLRSLHANFLQFVGMLEHVCLSSKDLRDEALLVRKARAHVNVQRDAPKVETAVHAGGNISAQGESSIISVYLDEQRDEELCTKILEAAADVSAALAARIDEVVPKKGVVVLVDRFDRLAGHPVAQWLADLTARTSRVAVVLTTTGGAAELDGRPVRDAPLLPFTEAQTRHYLQTCLDPGAVTSEIVAEVAVASDGLPFAVALATDLLEQRQASGEPVTLEGVRLDGFQHVLAVIVDEVPDPRVARVLRDGRLARRVDRGVIQWLLFGSDDRRSREDWEQAGVVLGELQRYSFIHQVAAPAVAWGETFRFHRYIRDTVRPNPPRALATDPEAVHRRLAELWLKRRDDAESRSTGPSRTYGDWYFYEQAGWQVASLEWLHHAGQLTDESDRARVRLELARLFLEAFWWWGWYVPFDFCAQILDDWRRTQPADEHELAEAFGDVLDGYPPGWRKTGLGDWPRVRAALLKARMLLGVQSYAKLEPRADAPRDEGLLEARRTVRALISHFLAHTYRYVTGAAAHASIFNDDALRWFEVNGQTVEQAWERCEMADFALECGDPAQALQQASEALRMFVAAEDEEVDHELLANLHRVRAGATLAAAGDLRRSVREMALAVVRAYTFLVRPHQPDPYTTAFYAEVRDRAGLLLQAIGRESGADTQLEAAGWLYDDLARLRADEPRPAPAADALLAAGGDATALADLLTPPVPVLGADATVLAAESTVSLLEPTLDVTAEFSST